MQVFVNKLNHALLPGDAVGQLKEEFSNQQTIKIGHGLIQHNDSIIATKAGILRYIPPNRYFIENNQHRYIPMVGDMVIGVIKDKVPGEQYSVDILAHQGNALLSFVGFDGASRRNRPDLGSGSLVYARVILANKDLDIEITCESFASMKKKDWSTGESTFGELKGGYVIECSIGLCRKLLDPNCYLLKAISDYVSFEVAVGLNGRVWINSDSNNDIILIGNAIQNSEHLSQEEVMKMLNYLFKIKKEEIIISNTPLLLI